MSTTSHVESSRQDALSRILEIVGAKSGKGVMYTAAALGIAALVPGLELPGVLGTIAGGIGVEAIGNIIDHVARSDEVSEDEIRRQVESALAQSCIDKLLTKDDYYHAFAHLRKGQRSLITQNSEIIDLLRRLESTLTAQTKPDHDSYAIPDRAELSSELQKFLQAGEGKTITDSDLESFFDGLYMLLLLDQMPGGLWGHSVGDRSEFSRETYKGSPTLSTFAAEAILRYTYDAQHESIDRFLEYVRASLSKTTGGFGLKIRFTTDPQVSDPFRIQENNRHTAGFAKTLMLVTQGVNWTIARAVEFLLQQEAGGEWGVEPHPKSQRADCITVAFVVDTLSLAGCFGVSKHLSEKHARALGAQILHGVNWLADHLVEDCWVYENRFERKHQYTMIVLHHAHAFREHYPDLHQRVLSRLWHEIQDQYGLVWLETPGDCHVSFSPSAQLVEVLLEASEDKRAWDTFRKLVLLSKSSEFFSHTYAVDWAHLLMLCTTRFSGTTLSAQRRQVLDGIAKDIMTKRIDGAELRDIYEMVPEYIRWIEPAIPRAL